MKMNFATMLALAAGTCLSTAVCMSLAKALDYYTINDADGNPFIQLRVFNVGDGAYASFGEGEEFSTWNLSKPQTDQVMAAVQYWGERIQVVPGQNPSIINLGTYNSAGASAYSPMSVQVPGSGTLTQEALINGQVGELQYGAHGIINIGAMNWALAPFIPSQIPLTPQVDMTTVLIHEVAHTLGVATTTMIHNDKEKDEGYFYFPAVLNAWSSHLRDDNGKAAAPNQIIYCNICSAPPEDADVFDVRHDQAYFTGDQVSEVLAGAMPGLRVRTGHDQTERDEPIFSHIELNNGLMSHHSYRNYTALMEAEVAALQDIGYTIDRRKFFGFSVYNDGLTLINDNPFFARNAAGTDYIANTYNMVPLGLGLHVYGSNNTIIQRADLLSAGAGGAGIRVDGASNDLTILPGTRVYAGGANGRGVMFAYGKDHSFTQRGDVETLGEHGIAVSFDFGHNLLGDSGEYRGSYFVTSQEYNIEDRFPDYYAAALAEVNAPLVTAFDLTGRVTGSYAAIYMSDNAYVSEINVMRGAKISGDIISNYNAVDENGDQRITNLTFGLKANGNGHSTGAADAGFVLSYNEDITGINNLSLQILGGITQMTGNHQLYDVNVAQGATLVGKGSYQINNDGTFSNHGTLAPSGTGKAITIDGTYIQSDTGRLQMAFNDQSVISSLIVHGEATIDGTLSFAPERGWYQNGFSVTSDKWLQVDTINGFFANVTTTLTSPTLTASATDNGDNSYTVALSRADNAYSRYGDSSISRAVGTVIDQITNNANPGLQLLVAALDFSAADGSTIRTALPQLSSEAYASATGVLVHDSGATRAAINGRLQQAFGGTAATPVAVMAFGPTAQQTAAGGAIDTIPPASTGASATPDDLARYTAWGAVFGGWTSHSGDGNIARTKSTLGGFISGIDASVYDNWRLGIMAGYSRSTFKTADRASSGSSDNYTIGAYTGTEWVTPHGAIGLRSGLAYTWHNLEMSRAVGFPGFTDNLSADYNAGTFQLFGELGYKVTISERSLIESYANLAYVNVRSDGFSEKGKNGAALTVQPDSMDATLSTLGIRASTRFDLNGIAATARADLGWRHAFGDIIPTSRASFTAGSSLFTVAGNAIGKNTALIEAGLDFQLSKNTTLGLAYQGQFGSGLTQNGVNTNLSVKF